MVIRDRHALPGVVVVYCCTANCHQLAALNSTVSFLTALPVRVWAKFSWILLTGTQRRAFIWKLWGSVHNETHPTSSRIQFLGGMAPPPLSLCCQPHSTPVPRLSPFLAQDPLRPQSKQLQVKRFPCLGLFAFLLSYPPENFFF